MTSRGYNAFINAIKNYITLNPSEEPINILEFARLISVDLNLQIAGQATPYVLEELYNDYLNEFYSRPVFATITDEPQNVNIKGFKQDKKYSKDDLKNLATRREYLSNHMSMKNNIKRYTLHKLAPRGSYIIDYVYFKNLTYLMIININTRYVMYEFANNVIIDTRLSETRTYETTINDINKAKKINVKNTHIYVYLLRRLYNQALETNNPIKHLTSDNEPAFISNVANTLYNQLGIEHMIVPRLWLGNERNNMTSEPYHTALTIMDRFV